MSAIYRLKKQYKFKKNPHFFLIISMHMTISYVNTCFWWFDSEYEKQMLALFNAYK